MKQPLNVLESIHSLQDLRALPARDIPQLAAEVRAFLVEHVSEQGGHLASNLGVVELSIALHRVFDTPTDRLVWDVGHQSYVHKILTGRADRFSELRVPGGLSGFTKREESEHDPFGAGHSSTALSAALGFAEADRLTGRENMTVAVVGDGAFTGGMVHEALNNCSKGLNLVVVLNENEMSISPNTGSFAKYLARLRTSDSYDRLKRGTAKFLRRIPLLGKPLFRFFLRIKIALKNRLYHSNYFEEMGLFYMGPLDGHDYHRLERALRQAKRKGEATLVHIKTKKGKGYQPAEDHPGDFHSVRACPSKGRTFHEVLGDELCRLAGEDERICAVTAAMKSGTGLSCFAEKYPHRLFDVGIAEAHALTFAAGLAAAGMKPYAAIYSTFLQRGYDNILHDIALQKLPVRLCIDRAGLAVSDGATHHGIFDVAFLSHIPDITLWAPATLTSLQRALEASKEFEGPLAIRYPNACDNPLIVETFFGKSEEEQGDPFQGVRADFTDPTALDAVVISYGAIVEEAILAKEQLAGQGVACGLILLEKLKPYEATLARLLPILPKDKPIVFLEEGIYNGGAGMIIGDLLRQSDPSFSGHYRVLAIKDHFASPTEKCNLYHYCGIAADDVTAAVRA